MASGTERYADIIDLPRPVSRRSKRMTPLERAAQFSPFAALVGFDAVIREVEAIWKGRFAVPWPCLGISRP